MKSLNSMDLILRGFVLCLQITKGRKYPAILNIHGGPKTVLSDIYHHEMQVMANSGYVVIYYCNPRGSDGKGDVFLTFVANTASLIMTI